MKHMQNIVFVMQENNKRSLTIDQDRAQLEMQIQTFKQSRGLFSLLFSTLNSLACRKYWEVVGFMDRECIGS